MKRKIFLFVLISIFSISLITTISLANSVSYSDTLPTFGHKTLSTGTKDNGLSYAKNVVGNSDCYYTGWLDYEHNGNWYQASENVDCYANKTTKINYFAIPASGTSVRLRTQGTYIFGGQNVMGTITY